MDDIKSYGLTLEELESRSLSDDENDQTIEPDEYDVMNDETFGANVDDIICDAELESYAAQTAKLRLDDSVWEQSIAPDVSDIPLPVWDFPTGLDSFANNQSIWSNSINDSAKNYSLWQPLSSVAENESEEWPKESDFFKESGEVPDKKIASKNEPIPQHAMSITEIEKLMLNDELVKKQFEDYDSPSPVVTQSAPPSQPHELPMSNETSNNLASLGLQPIHPSSALTIDQIEAEMLKQQAAPSPRKAARTPKPENSRNDYRQQQVQPGQFMSHMNMLPPMPLLPLPINPMVIASIPPLPPHLLQCLPVWIHAIVTNSKPPNLPNDFPPPPFFLTDLMNDPNLVSTLVVQASSLPFRQPLPPQLHPQLPQQIIESRPQSRMTNNTEFSRANSSLPSDRVIKDLAFDSFAGYMSCKEREWLVKIQIHQMQGCGDPLVEDYYYVKWKEAKIAAGCTSNPKVHNQKSQKVELYSEREMRLRYVEKRNRENNIRAVRDAKERESKKEEIEKEKAADRELRINTTLGKLTKPTKHNPRKQVVVKSEGRESPAHAPLTDDAKRQLVTKKLRTMLLRLELYLTSLMEAAELDSQKLSEKSRFAELTPEERAVQAAEKIEFVIKDISGSDFFKILQMSKGRRLVQRLLAATSAKDQARLILSLFMAVPLLNSKYHEEVCKEVILVLYRALAAWTRDQLNSLLSVIDLTSVSKTNAKENKVLRDLLFSITFACYKKSANRPEKILALIHSAKFSLQLKDWTSVVLLPETELEGFSRYITSK